MRNCMPIWSAMLLTTKLMFDWLKEIEVATRWETTCPVAAATRTRPTAAGRLWRGWQRIHARCRESDRRLRRVAHASRVLVSVPRRNKLSGSRIQNRPRNTRIDANCFLISRLILGFLFSVIRVIRVIRGQQSWLRSAKRANRSQFATRTAFWDNETWRRFTSRQPL
jgi:hypothetical protein